MLSYDLVASWEYVTEQKWTWKTSDLQIPVSAPGAYLVEAINCAISKEELKASVWEGYLTQEGAIYSCYEATPENPIDTKALTDVFLEILRKQYE